MRIRNLRHFRFVPYEPPRPLVWEWRPFDADGPCWELEEEPVGLFLTHRDKWPIAPSSTDSLESG